DDAVGRGSPEHRHLDRRVARIQAGPGGPGVEVLIDETVVEPGQRHPFRAPLPEPHAVAPAVTAEAHRSSGRRRRTGWPVRCAGTAERRLRRLRFIAVERRLQRAALALKPREPDQRLAALTVEVTVIARDRGDLTGDRIGARLERVEQRREVRASLGQYTALRLQRIALGTQLAGQLKLGDRDLLQIDAAVEQAVEAAAPVPPAPAPADRRACWDHPRAPARR